MSNNILLLNQKIAELIKNEKLLEADSLLPSPSTKIALAEKLHPFLGFKDLSVVVKILQRGIRMGDRSVRLKVLQRKDYQKCIDKLALIYCQNFPQDNKKIADLLSMGGYTRRLSSHVLNYSPDDLVPDLNDDSHDFITILDNVFKAKTLKVLQTFFKRKAQFWTDHNYNEFKSNGYFSYVYILGSTPKTLIEKTIEQVWLLLQQEYPEKSKTVKVAEWWAHCRPHCQGHQFHYDSENEGNGVLRHPIFSAVLYLSKENSLTDAPTVITNQKLGGPLASLGYMSTPVTNRLAIFDSTYLHGVVPGKFKINNPVVSDRRVSFMIGFWDSITIQADPGIGASRKCDYSKAWTKNYANHEPELDLEAMSKANTLILPSIWQSINGSELDNHVLPTYNQCFQGF